MMTTTVKMPPLGESVLEGTVGKWLVREGQRIEREQPVVEILTDKTDSEIPAPVGGVVVKILAVEGTTVLVGGDLAIIDESATASAGPAAAAAPAPVATPVVETKAAPPASPATRKLAREMGVDLANVEGSGRGGVVLHEDVLRGAAPAPVAAAPAPLPPAPIRPSSAGAVTGFTGTLPEVFKILNGQGNFKLPPYNPAPGDKIVPYNRRRRIIADHMVFSKMTAPHVVTFAECDLHKTHLLREKNKDALKKEGIGLTFLSFVAAACARALRENPTLNARVLEDSYALLHDINLGIAVETPEGLVVPVVKHADELRVRGLARAIDQVAERARTGNLVPDDLANKTFTISNPGRKGNLVGGAIISQPNVGILRIGEIKKRPVVVEREGEDVIAIHPVMFMALSYDHRIVDGVAANNFLFRVNEILEQGDFEI
jgi:2-oxoglutarate dehydrogenase E2 component (dihydrolipoamide succinyltransferase)